MRELRQFRKVNNLLQKDVADYLGVTREFISIVENGKTGLPEEHLRKLQSNDRGWDTSMLVEGNPQDEPEVRRGGLCRTIEEQERQIAELEAILEEKRQENAWLRSLVEKYITGKDK